MTPARRRAVAGATLALFAAAIGAARLWLSTAPVHADASAWAVIGHEMTVGGRPLYSDLWERKPPLLYLTFAAAERATGYNPHEIVLAGVLAAWATLVGVYLVGRAHGGPAAGIIAAGLWTLVSSDLSLTANGLDPEAFINAALTAAVAVLLAPSRPWRAALAGVLLAAATFYKHNAALAAGAILLGYVLTTRRLRPALVAGSIVAAAWAAFLGRAYAVGRGAATVDVLFRQNAAYSGGNPAANLIGGLAPDRLFPPFLLAIAAPVLLVVIFAAMPRTGRRIGPAWGLWTAWAVGTWATVSLTGLLYPHYYQLWLPIACVGGGWAAAGLLRSRSGRVAVTAVLVAVAVRQASQFRKTPAEWTREQFDYSVAHQNAFARWISRTLHPHERFWELGNDDNLYFLSDRSPPSGLLYVDPLLYGTDPSAAWRRLLSDLDRRPPDLVVLSSDWQVFFTRADLPIYPWLRQRYTAGPTLRYADGPDRPTTYSLFLRKGSDLQRRLSGRR